jgi:hypothetical protein
MLIIAFKIIKWPSNSRLSKGSYQGEINAKP